MIKMECVVLVEQEPNEPPVVLCKKDDFLFAGKFTMERREYLFVEKEKNLKVGFTKDEMKKRMDDNGLEEYTFMRIYQRIEDGKDVFKWTHDFGIRNSKLDEINGFIPDSIPRIELRNLDEFRSVMIKDDKFVIPDPDVEIQTFFL